MFLDSFLSQASVASCFLGLIFFLLPTLSSPYYIPFFLNQAKKALVIVLPVHIPNFLINTSSAGSPLRHFIFVPSIYTDQLLEGLQTQPAVWKLLANSMQCYHSVYLAVCTAGISLCVLYSACNRSNSVCYTYLLQCMLLLLFCLSSAHGFWILLAFLTKLAKDHIFFPIREKLQQGTQSINHWIRMHKKTP